MKQLLPNVLSKTLSLRLLISLYHANEPKEELILMRQFQFCPLVRTLISHNVVEMNATLWKTERYKAQNVISVLFGVSADRLAVKRSRITIKVLYLL